MFVREIGMIKFPVNPRHARRYKLNDPTDQEDFTRS